MYHSIGDDGSFLTVKADDLEKQMIYLHKENGHKFSVVKLSELYKQIRQVEPSSGFVLGSVVLTFDDAYENFYGTVWPLLKKNKIPATVFVPTALMGQTWKMSDGTQIPLMTAEMIREIAADGLVEFMPHTETHVDLEVLSPELYEKEIEKSRVTLEHLTGKKCSIISYPKGRLCQNVVDYLQGHGWIGGVGMFFGLISKDSHPFCLPRNRIDSKTSPALFKLFLSDRFRVFQAIIWK